MDVCEFLAGISIHATRTGSDMIGFFPAPYPFLFTPPTWAATIARIIRDYNISIHATRTGGDFLLTPTSPPIVISIHATRAGSDLLPDCGVAHFYSRRPYGQRRLRPVCEDVVQFLFTPPVRVATGGDFDVAGSISIHATRAGSDKMRVSHCWLTSLFLFTPPVRAATWCLAGAANRRIFLFTPPVWAATSWVPHWSYSI